MREDIKKLLSKVEKPARYSGGEFNSLPVKQSAAIKFLLCFPDVYEVAMSNLGIKILYEILNRNSDISCEMCYAPWIDMGEALKNNQIALFGLSSQMPMSSYDIVGFSLQYEMSYTNMLYMLDLGRVPLLRTQRKESDPIVIAGGPCCINPFPLTDFVDIFCIGDGEETDERICMLLKEAKEKGYDRKTFLGLAAKLDGVFVPEIGNRPRRAVVPLESAVFPTKVQIPNVEAVHNRAMLELFRGCSRGCRFCQAGMIYRPVRERNPETLARYAFELVNNNGFEEMSLSSLSTCDYPYLKTLLTSIKPELDRRGVKISLPSTRVDSFEAQYVEDSRLSSITFAPEAGTQRLRDVINKNVTEKDVFNSMKYAFSKGYSSVKLYFIIGLPTETTQDLNGIIQLASEIKKLYKQYSTTKKQLSITISTSTLVPKPFTAFQWERQISLSEIEEKQNFLKEGLKKLGVKYKWHNGKTSILETALARGDERLGKVILSAYLNGCKFDSWDELFDFKGWEDAFAEHNVKIEDYTSEIPLDVELPWDRIDVGIDKEFLKNERSKAYEGALTFDCRGGCHNCGINKTYPEIFSEFCLKRRKI